MATILDFLRDVENAQGTFEVQDSEQASRGLFVLRLTDFNDFFVPSRWRVVSICKYPTHYTIVLMFVNC